jgi:hypothetical protein
VCMAQLYPSREDLGQQLMYSFGSQLALTTAGASGMGYTIVVDLEVARGNSIGISFYVLWCKGKIYECGFGDREGGVPLLFRCKLCSRTST